MSKYSNETTVIVYDNSEGVGIKVSSESDIGAVRITTPDGGEFYGFSNLTIPNDMVNSLCEALKTVVECTDWD